MQKSFLTRFNDKENNSTNYRPHASKLAFTVKWAHSSQRALVRIE